MPGLEKQTPAFAGYRPRRTNRRFKSPRGITVAGWLQAGLKAVPGVVKLLVGVRAFEGGDVVGADAEGRIPALSSEFRRGREPLTKLVEEPS